MIAVEQMPGQGCVAWCYFLVQQKKIVQQKSAVRYSTMMVLVMLMSLELPCVKEECV